jgi:hypothetical protein
MEHVFIVKNFTANNRKLSTEAVNLILSINFLFVLFHFIVLLFSIFLFSITKSE